MNIKPVLILGTHKGFGDYAGEVLKAEGINSFDYSISNNLQFGNELLHKYEIVILSEVNINNEQKATIKEYVSSGGSLIAFRPDRILSELFGVVPEGEVIKEGYIKTNNLSKIIKGITQETIQFHGEADVYNLMGAEEISVLYRSSTESAGKPAVVINRYGKGLAAAFFYNMPESVIMTRQGNPEMAGIEGDGIIGIRGTDLFGNGWLDVSKSHINQADEHMRILSKIIEYVYSKPLPRFWYFPEKLKSLVIFTNDGEDSTEEEFDVQFADVESKGALMSLYVKELDLLRPEKVKILVDHGHEISGHPDDTIEAENPTWERMDSVLGSMVESIRTRYGQKMDTIVNHWFVWVGKSPDGNRDFTAMAKLEEKHGIKMDLNYGHYDLNAAEGYSLGPAGNFTGSGLPMRFCDMDGKVVNVYQVLTNVYDQYYMEINDAEAFFNCFKTILDRSVNEGRYSCIGLKAHNDEWHWTKEPVMKMLDYANEKGIPIWTAKKLLDFLEMKDSAVFTDIEWLDGSVSFVIDVPEPGKGLTFFLPVWYKEQKLKSIFLDKTAAEYAVFKREGREFAFVTISGGCRIEVEAVYT